MSTSSNGPRKGNRGGLACRLKPHALPHLWPANSTVRCRQSAHSRRLPFPPTRRGSRARLHSRRGAFSARAYRDARSSMQMRAAAEAAAVEAAAEPAHVAKTAAEAAHVAETSGSESGAAGEPAEAARVAKSAAVEAMSAVEAAAVAIAEPAIVRPVVAPVVAIVRPVIAVVRAGAVRISVRPIVAVGIAGGRAGDAADHARGGSGAGIVGVAGTVPIPVDVAMPAPPDVVMMGIGVVMRGAMGTVPVNGRSAGRGDQRCRDEDGAKPGSRKTKSTERHGVPPYDSRRPELQNVPANHPGRSTRSRL